MTPVNYTIYSALCMSSAAPLVLGASFPTTPPPNAAGLVETVTYDGESMDQIWTLLPLATSNSAVLIHQASGYAARWGAQDTQITLANFIPYDWTFIVTLNVTSAMNMLIQQPGTGNLVFSVPGSNWRPNAPVFGSLATQAQGQSWMFVPLAE